jgi:AraC family transcriptional regulator, transcriptional activator of pobA
MVSTARRRAASRVPAFALYGETGSPDAQLLHIEPIAVRSARYRWEIGAHRHQGLCQAVWLDAGAVRVSLDEQMQTLAAPACVVLPPNVVHAFRFAPGTQGWVLTFSPRQLLEGEAAATAGPLEALFEQPLLAALDAEDAAVARQAAVWRSLGAEFGAAPGGSPAVTWLARALVWQLGRLLHKRQSRPSAPRHPALYTRFVRLVEQHHPAHWPVSRYAQVLGLSTERLNRLTRAEAGCAALHVVHERLLREAQRQLLYTRVPVSQIAFDLGFQDPAYFTRFFKRGAGETPRAWRARQAP